MSEETKPNKIVVPAEDMKRINEGIKRYRLMGAPEEKIKAYFSACVEAYAHYNKCIKPTE